MGWFDESTTTSKNQDWFGGQSSMAGQSSQPYSQFSNNWYLDDDTSWISSFDESFGAIDTSDSYLSSLWGAINTPVGMQTVQGAIGAGVAAYNANKQDDQSSKNRADMNMWKEKELEIAQQKLALEGGLLDLQNRTLDDKIQTRARHNASINVKPNSAKKVRFGA